MCKYCGRPVTKKQLAENGYAHSYCRQKANESEISAIRTMFRKFKYSAKRRGIYFSVPLEFFVTFVVATGYLNNRGRGSGDMSIDRIDIAKGYTEDNLQVITNRDNIKKRSRVDYKNKWGVKGLERKSVDPF